MRGWIGRRRFCTACLLLVFACSAGETGSASKPFAAPEIVSVAGIAGAPRTGQAFKNLDPAYQRVSFYDRLHSLTVGGTWLIPESRVAPLVSVAPDLQRLRQNTRDATVTWIGHSTLLVQLDGVNFFTDPTSSPITGRP